MYILTPIIKISLNNKLKKKKKKQGNFFFLIFHKYYSFSYFLYLKDYLIDAIFALTKFSNKIIMNFFLPTFCVT